MRMVRLAAVMAAVLLMMLASGVARAFTTPPPVTDTPAAEVTAEPTELGMDERIRQATAQAAEMSNRAPSASLTDTSAGGGGGGGGQALLVAILIALGLAVIGISRATRKP